LTHATNGRKKNIRRSYLSSHRLNKLVDLVPARHV
jgi:hypothetical protein